ncbi:hypothetical protein [Natrinema versiforme]|uniref:Uncharacterized protein n=1 Tax=Natrinema versiforme JCM 10478 TaxID=1227496 RepID=L9XWN5_9EURY|nr:hypothetical protein [Natrinema versiforme]ELY64998.1 hypothetical protein C489_16326 [Natrinema versiforme JCM 10478]
MSDHSRRSRRTVLRTLGVLGAGTLATPAAAGASTGNSSERPDAAIDDELDGTDLYVGVVDRIVDDEHVVLLLEDGEAVVDQLVLPVDRFEAIAANDILLTAVVDGELRAHRYVPAKPNGCPDPDFERLSADG